MAARVRRRGGPHGRSYDVVRSRRVDWVARRQHMPFASAPRSIWCRHKHVVVVRCHFCASLAVACASHGRCIAVDCSFSVVNGVWMVPLTVSELHRLSLSASWNAGCSWAMQSRRFPSVLCSLAVSVWSGNHLPSNTSIGPMCMNIDTVSDLACFRISPPDLSRSRHLSHSDRLPGALIM